MEIASWRQDRPEVPDFIPPTWKAKSVEAQNKLAMMWAILKKK